MKASVLHNTVKELVVKQMDDDLEHLCRKQTNSILRQTKPAELVSFDMSKLVCELEKEAPFVWQVLKSVSFMKKNKKRVHSRGHSNLRNQCRCTSRHFFLQRRGDKKSPPPTHKAISFYHENKEVSLNG